MAGKRRYTAAQVIDALNQCQGLVYLAAERLGCTSETICNYKRRYPAIRQAIDEKRGKRIDTAEAALDRAVLAGESWAVKFILNCLAKDRGYVERQEAKNAFDPDSFLAGLGVLGERVKQIALGQVPDRDGKVASENGAGKIASGGPIPGPGGIRPSGPEGGANPSLPGSAPQFD